MTNRAFRISIARGKEMLFCTGCPIREERNDLLLIEKLNLIQQSRRSTGFLLWIWVGSMVAVIITNGSLDDGWVVSWWSFGGGFPMGPPFVVFVPFLQNDHHHHQRSSVYIWIRTLVSWLLLFTVHTGWTGGYGGWIWMERSPCVVCGGRLYVVQFIVVSLSSWSGRDANEWLFAVCTKRVIYRDWQDIKALTAQK